MTVFEHIEKLPFVEVTVKLYEVSEPYKVENGTSSYFATFSYPGSYVGPTTDPVIDISCPMGGGAYIDLQKRTGASGHRQRFYLPPDDLVMALLRKLDYDPEKDIEEATQRENERYSIAERKRLEELQAAQEIRELEENAPTQAIPIPISDEAPNWLANRHMGGGHLADIPEPWVRFYPHPFGKKRKIKISIHRYYGQGIHYFVSIHEEDNPIWNRVEHYWQIAWDDKDGKGRDIFNWMEEFGVENAYHFDLLIQAKEAIDKIVDKLSDDYEIEIDSHMLSDEDGRMFYGNKHGE